MGTASFSGQLENRGIRTTAEQDISDMKSGMQAIIKKAIDKIFNTTHPTGAGWLSKYRAKAFADPFSITRIDIDLDTISEMGTLSLEVEFDILGIKVVLSDINIKGMV